MFIASNSRCNRPQRIIPAERRGVALVFVLVFVIAMAALAMSSIFMASNANLLAKSYDRERDLKYAAEAALAIGKSRVNADPLILTMKPTQVDTPILKNYAITGANGQQIAGITVNVYVGPTGSTSGQFGRFSSIVAEARDQRGNGFIRRLELTQESFAKFAYWSNSESNGSSTIFFNNNDALWGPVWSNDTISIGSGGASFHDEVGTVFFIAGANYGTFSKGKKEYQKPIALPSVAVLNNLQTIAASSGWSFHSDRGASQDATQVRDRIEFVAIDLDNASDSTDVNEGMFMVFDANSDALARGDWPVTGTTVAIPSQVTLCGDWHSIRLDSNNVATRALQFYPASVHNTDWFAADFRRSVKDDNPTWNNTLLDNARTAERNLSVGGIMDHPNARCYLPGDPHLAPVERNIAQYPLAIHREKGGMDSTFTPIGNHGSWRISNATPPNTIVNATVKKGNQIAKYMFPIDRFYNSNAKGVIYFDGNVAISGTLNGRITLYALGSIVMVDDIRYANDPVKGVCRDILGLISGKDMVIADNAINTPQLTATSSYNINDDTKDFYIHAVMMALGTSFRAERHDQEPHNANTCDATTNGRGCIYLSGGIIQQSRGPVGLSTGQGFAKRYSYDHCAVVNPPPYFPTTGRFQDNRYLELDPAGFNHVNYFKTLVPDP